LPAHDGAGVISISRSPITIVIIGLTIRLAGSPSLSIAPGGQSVRLGPDAASPPTTIRRWYWEVGETRLVHRRFLVRTTYPFSDITYVGPMTGEGSGYTFFEKTILVRTAEGQRMFIDTTDPDALLAEMRQRLPGITLNL